MTVYLDASVLVSLFVSDPLTSRAESFLRREAPAVAVSDFSRAEFASAVARRVRMTELSSAEAREVFSTFDLWATRADRRLTMVPADVELATSFLRRLDLSLRTPDALNIAIAARSGCRLLTFDQKMAISAETLGLTLAMA